MPTPEERDAMSLTPRQARFRDDFCLDDLAPMKVPKSLEDALEQATNNLRAALAKQPCVCPALYTNPDCPRHGSEWMRHLANRK